MTALGSFGIIAGGADCATCICGAEGISNCAEGAGGTGADAAGGIWTEISMGLPLRNIIDGSSILG